MISTEATREGGRSKLQTRFLKIHTVNVTKFVTEFGHHRLCRAPHEELLRKLGLTLTPLALTVVFQEVSDCPVLENGQVESFRRALIGSH